MYMPAHFKVTDQSELHSVITQYPLGTWIVSAVHELEINHVPFLLDTTRGKYGTLIGHVARANPVWQLLTSGVASAVVFHAEQGYISPSWYPGKQEHHRVVPTWNYAVVHVHGTAEVIDDRNWLLAHVTALSNLHEQHQQTPWDVSEAPADYLDKMLAAIVGIAIPIDSLIGKFKLSQNRSRADQSGVVSGLKASDNADALALAQRMKPDGT